MGVIKRVMSNELAERRAAPERVADPTVRTVDAERAGAWVVNFVSRVIGEDEIVTNAAVSHGMGATIASVVRRAPVDRERVSRAVDVDHFARFVNR
jgi:hypothetical protein